MKIIAIVPPWSGLARQKDARRTGNQIMGWHSAILPPRRPARLVHESARAREGAVKRGGEWPQSDKELHERAGQRTEGCSR